MDQKTIRAIFVNGSPCKKWNTAKMLESAMKGALTSLLLLFATPGLHAKSWTPAEVKSVVRQVNTYWQQHNAAEVRAFWDHAAYHTGNMEVYNLLQDEQMLAYSLRWAEHNRWQGATERDRTKWKYKRYGEGQDFVLFGDWQICFQTYIDLYRLHPDEQRVARAREVMGYIADSPADDYWWWADALYMVMPVMTKMYRLTGERKYLYKFYDNLLYSDSIMLDQETGLYFRDGKYVYPKHQSANGKKDFWARGDGWVLAGLAKVLHDMPVTYEHRQFFLDKYQRMARSVAALQQPEGYWTRSMMDPAHAPGPETSGTAFFTYGLLWGVNHGYLSRTDFVPVIEKAWHYLTTVALQPDGKVGYVQPIGERAIPGQTVNANSQANFGVGAFLLAACEYARFLSDKTVTLTVTNPTGRQRQEVVEVDLHTLCAKMALDDTDPLTVTDGQGVELPSQKTHDGKFLFFATVQPRSTASFRVRCAVPSPMQSSVKGAVYPKRLDDLPWENDRAIFRIYGPAAQRRGQQLYGVDVWVKNTPDLVADYRYRLHLWGVALGDSLKAAGRRFEAEQLYNACSFHIDHGQGLDCYGVGATLGCGAPALMSDGQLLFSRCYRTCRIVDNGPLRFTALLDFDTQDAQLTEHRVVSLDRGSHFNKVTVSYDGMSRPAELVTGVVLHDSSKPLLTKNYVLYADPTENPRLHQSQIFTGTLYPQGVSKTLTTQGRQSSHALGTVRQYRGAPYTYYAGAAWSSYDMPTLAAWQLHAEETLDNIAHPLTVQIR